MSRVPVAPGSVAPACAGGALVGRGAPGPLSGAAWAGLKVGVLGGSFNPAHDGHRMVSEVALRLLRLDQVWWLVSPQNPLKSPQDMAGQAQRLIWARAAARHPRILATTLEARLGTRYTADSLRELAQRYPRTRFVWLMGADNLDQVRRWQHWTRIFASVPVAVFSRSPYSLKALNGIAARRFRARRIGLCGAGRLADMVPPAWVFFRNPWHPASATAIRAGAGGPPKPGPLKPGEFKPGEFKPGQTMPEPPATD
ncbi:MAG: nicotinate-nucleotide adenylyltransferase [Azospirillum sp.]|nr:nicotinate-nucleotide adenylyltransferase [Azospirillum sp.]